MTHVAGQEPTRRDRARTRRRTGAIAASVLAHAVVFAIMGLTVPRLITPDLPPAQAVNIWLMPHLTPLEHKPVEHQETAASLPTFAQPRLPKPAPAQIRPPAAPANAPPAVLAPGPAKAPPVASSEGDTTGGMKEALRTSVGCDADNVVHLTPYERDRCNQRFGEIARKTPPFSGIDGGKRIRFDAQAEADERRRANREGVMPPGIAPCTGEGSNFGVGCLPDSAIAHVHPH